MLRRIVVAAAWAGAWCALPRLEELSGGAPVTLLDLDLTVDGFATKLTLVEGQSYLAAAQAACKPVLEPAAIDNCVGGAMTIIVNQHLAKKAPPRAAAADEAAPPTLASPGVSLVRGALEHYDPVTWVGASPLHVDIELPVQTRRTVCDAERCWELDDNDGVPVANHTLHVPAWSHDTSGVAREAALALDLWREADLALIEHRVSLERTRKSTPVDSRLRRDATAAPVVSFDGFYPTYFVLHTQGLFFDAQRVKVSGDFHPPRDGDVCVRAGRDRVQRHFNMSLTAVSRSEKLSESPVCRTWVCKKVSANLRRMVPR